MPPLEPHVDDSNVSKGDSTGTSSIIGKTINVTSSPAKQGKSNRLQVAQLRTLIRENSFNGTKLFNKLSSQEQVLSKLLSDLSPQKQHPRSPMMMKERHSKGSLMTPEEHQQMKNKVQLAALKEILDEDNLIVNGISLKKKQRINNTQNTLAVDMLKRLCFNLCASYEGHFCFNYQYAFEEIIVRLARSIDADETKQKMEKLLHCPDDLMVVDHIRNNESGRPISKHEPTKVELFVGSNCIHGVVTHFYRFDLISNPSSKNRVLERHMKKNDVNNVMIGMKIEVTNRFSIGGVGNDVKTMKVSIVEGAGKLL